MSFPAILALEDGSIFYGEGFGEEKIEVGEIVFNTSMTGYQEIISDPSYAEQIISFTYPHIGNVGINEEDFESDQIYSKGIIIHDLPFQHSNFRSHCPLSEFLIKKNIVGIAGIDTRSLTRHLREHGAQSGCIFADKNIDETHALKIAQEFSGLLGLDLAQKVTTKTSYNFNEGEWSLSKGFEKITIKN